MSARDTRRGSRRSPMRAAFLLLSAVLALVIVATATVIALNRLDEDPADSTHRATGPTQGATSAAQDGAGARPAEPGSDASAALVARGAYLARAGNCAGCHTRQGGTAYAGGRAIETPFGAVYAPNLTPHDDAGLGRWTAAEFWRAMHNGRSRDGRLLYPAFPYPNYSLVTRADTDALFAWLRTLPPAPDATPPHRLRFPYDTQAALAVWRALYFRPARFEADPARDAAWNRGAYLVRGLGHCGACHDGRNPLGAPRHQDGLGGGLIPAQNWYAPALNRRSEAGVAHWDETDVIALLRTGVSRHGSVLGPMADVVRNSTQYLDAGDLRAMSVYLRSLTQADADAREADAGAGAPAHGPDPAPATGSAPGSGPAPGSAPAPAASIGARLYDMHCAQCHGDRGEGVAGIYPRLAGNRSVMHEPPANLVRIVLSGGFAPVTAGNPRPFGMPPFATVLDDADLAAVLTHVRTSWGNQARALSAHDINRYRDAAQR